jgi:RimJ/RimL family protein N-acetyltransferase
MTQSGRLDEPPAPARIVGLGGLTLSAKTQTMHPCPCLETARLILRRWREPDLAPFARLNCDPAVMEYMPKLLTREESDAFAARIEAHFEAHGFGLWAAELRAAAECIGFVGLSIPRFAASFTPCVEIGWRLAQAHWGRGLATEGARAVARYAFENLKLPELVSFTVPANARSRRVMEKLGMTHDPGDDFDHPLLPAGHPLRRHVLYRLGAHQFADGPP